MDVLLLDDVVDVSPAERAQMAYHFGITPTEVAAMEREVSPLPSGPLYVPDGWQPAYR